MYLCISAISLIVFVEIYPQVALILYYQQVQRMKGSDCFTPCLSIVCFSNAFPGGDQENLVFCFILCCCGGNISSPVRYSYLTILPDDNGDIFATTLLMSYWNFLSLILSTMVMIILYTSSNRLFQIDCPIEE